MSARLLKPNIALITLLVELRYTLSRLIANPLTASFVAPFQALRAQWTTVQAQEISLNESLSDAKAQVDIADAALDDFAVRFSNAVLALTGQKRDADLYRNYFKVPLSELRKPVLRGQLDAMSDWLISLAAAGAPPSLVAMKAELQALVATATTAQQTRDDLVVKIRDFRDVGERAQLFDAVNAERKSTDGALGKLALATPGLPASFQAQFFKPSEAEDAPEETVESVTAELKALGDKTTERTARLAELKKAADDAAKAAADKAAKQAQAEALDKEIEAKKKELQALKDEIKK